MDTIFGLLKKLEVEKNITILYAVESGSRAWGFASNDSDYDIRFIYKHNDYKKYLTVSKHRDTIDGFSDDRVYDWSGWDITKAIKHLKESNPSIIEWLYSPIVYIETLQSRAFRNGMCQLLNKMHTKTSLMYHYKSMAYTNWMDNINDKVEVNLKKYFYVIRPVAMLYMLLTIDDDIKLNDYMRIDFKGIIDYLLLVSNSLLDDKVYTEIQLLLMKKQSSKELGYGLRIETIDVWIMNVFEMFEKHTHADKKGVNEQSTITLYKKIQNEYKKVITIKNKRDKISRADYLNLISFILQYQWLKLNPDRNFRNIPKNISDMLNDIEQLIDENGNTNEREIYTIIHQIIENKGKDDIIEVDKVSRCISKERLFEIFYTNGVMKICGELANEFGITDFLIGDLQKKIEQIGEGEVLRTDLIEFHVKQFICSVFWLIENTKYPIRQIPREDIIDKVSFTPEFKGKLKQLIVENKIKYKMNTNDKIDEWVLKLIKNDKEFINERIRKHLHIKEEKVKVEYDNSIKDIPSELFDEFFHKVILEFH